MAGWCFVEGLIWVCGKDIKVYVNANMNVYIYIYIYVCVVGILTFGFAMNVQSTEHK